VNRGLFPHVGFPDYALLDSGGGEKLERFAGVVVRRPDPQALWPRGEPEARWRDADLTFVPDASSGGRGGRWTARTSGKGAKAVAKAPPAEWRVRCGDATLLARPTPFKHVGIFPEQSANWELLRSVRPRLAASPPRLLNLFGYTGAASIVALRAGYEATHVDASKTSLAWARANLQASGLSEDAMRIVLEDALAFAQREARRGSNYHVILMDPPHYGRGPKGEKWQFEDAIAALVAAVRELAAERSLVVLSTYAIGTSPLSLENLLADLGDGALESGGLALPEESARARLLPAGFCARWTRGLAG